MAEHRGSVHSVCTGMGEDERRQVGESRWHEAMSARSREPRIHPSFSPGSPVAKPHTQSGFQKSHTTEDGPKFHGHQCGTHSRCGIQKALCVTYSLSYTGPHKDSPCWLQEEEQEGHQLCCGVGGHSKRDVLFLGPKTSLQILDPQTPTATATCPARSSEPHGDQGWSFHPWAVLAAAC